MSNHLRSTPSDRETCHDSQKTVSTKGVCCATVVLHTFASPAFTLRGFLATQSGVVTALDSAQAYDRMSASATRDVFNKSVGLP